MPRLRQLFASGFGYIAFLMANIYNSVRLLPNNHPYMNPQNIGKYGIRHVIGEAANNLVVKKENIDQLVIFVALLAGVVILTMQIALVLYSFIFQPAMAISIFDTPNPSSGGSLTDIAFVLLDDVFGVPGVFCNFGGMCTTVAAGGGPPPTPFPTAFHTALHSMFQFYSLGILLIGVLIVLYFILVIVLETATTGTPFGQRFANVWVPIRVVVAIGLLVPLNFGLNSGQYITLYAAKYGSGFATNAWLRYNNTIATSGIYGSGGQNPTGERESLLALPKSPDIGPVVQFMSIVHACAYLYWEYDSDRPDASAKPPDNNFYIRPYLVKHRRDWLTDPNIFLVVDELTDYLTALDFYDNSDIIIRFGRNGATSTKHDDVERSENERGGILPHCGEIRIRISDLANRGQGNAAGIGGPDQMQEFYFNLVKLMWFGTIPGVGANSELEQLSHRYAEIASVIPPNNQCNIGAGNTRLPGLASCADLMPDAAARQNLIQDYQTLLDQEILVAWNRYNTTGTDIEIQPEVLDRGWAGAGIWYTTIAQVNGSWITSVVDIPSVNAYPEIMEHVREENRSQNSESSGVEEEFCPWSSQDANKYRAAAIPGGDNALAIGGILCGFYKYWNTDGSSQKYSDKVITGNAFEDTMNAIFGTQGLFNMRGRNAHIHPLAQLAALGKGLVDSTIRNVAISTAAGALAGPIGIMDPHLGKIAGGASGMLTATAFVGLTAGFVLFYVLPFLPFVYFYFAVGSWIKTIFEAMVGVPLWALAHLRLDGEGLPGESASNGYFLILEIFLRPILTVFGLVASMVIFTALIRVLSFIWTLVTDNLTGFKAADTTLLIPGDTNDLSLRRNIIDNFFFTIIYAIIVYMIGIASFKLIDKIPDNILRWMGSGVSSFSDINQDPTEGLTKYAALGGLTVGQQAVGGIQKAASGTGGALAGELQNIRNVLNN